MTELIQNMKIVKQSALLGVVLILLVLGFLGVNKYHFIVSQKIPFFSVPPGHVRIDFINNSMTHIDSVKIDGYLKTIKNLKQNKRKSVSFNVEGESTYSYVVYFMNGVVLKSKERYIETGYHSKENIRGQKHH
ncbi:MAG: hypothetical protein JXR19_07780 [Bacteroidia bacterium]